MVELLGSGKNKKQSNQGQHRRAYPGVAARSIRCFHNSLHSDSKPVLKRLPGIAHPFPVAKSAGLVQHLVTSGESRYLVLYTVLMTVSDRGTPVQARAVFCCFFRHFAGCRAITQRRGPPGARPGHGPAGSRIGSMDSRNTNRYNTPQFKASRPEEASTTMQAFSFDTSTRFFRTQIFMGF
jgi:hypothetical protein